MTQVHQDSFITQIHKNIESKGKCLQFCKNIIKNHDKKILNMFNKIKHKEFQLKQAQNVQRQLRQQRKQKTERTSHKNEENINFFHNFFKQKHTSSKKLNQNQEFLYQIGSQYGDHDYDNDLQDFIKSPKQTKDNSNFKNLIKSCNKNIFNINSQTKGRLQNSCSDKKQSLYLDIFKSKFKDISKNKKLQSQKCLFSNIKEHIDTQKINYHKTKQFFLNQNSYSPRRRDIAYLDSAYFRHIKKNLDSQKLKKIKTEISTPNYQNQFDSFPSKEIKQVRKHQRYKTQSHQENVFESYDKLKNCRLHKKKQIKLHLKELVISPQNQNCFKKNYYSQNKSPIYCKAPFQVSSNQKASNLIFQRTKTQVSPRHRNEVNFTMTSNQKNRKNQTQSINIIKKKFQQLSEPRNNINQSKPNSPKNLNNFINLAEIDLIKHFQEQKKSCNNLQNKKKEEQQYCEIKYNGIKFKAKIIKSNAEILLKKFKNKKANILNKNFQTLQQMRKVRTGIYKK